MNFTCARWGPTGARLFTGGSAAPSHPLELPLVVLMPLKTIIRPVAIEPAAETRHAGHPTWPCDGGNRCTRLRAIDWQVNSGGDWTKQMGDWPMRGVLFAVTRRHCYQQIKDGDDIYTTIDCTTVWRDLRWKLIELITSFLLLFDQLLLSLLLLLQGRDVIMYATKRRRRNVKS